MACLSTGNRNLAAHETRSIADVYKSYTYFQDGDVLLAKITPCFENGKLGVARELKSGIGFGSSEFFVIRPGNQILSNYIYYYLDQQCFRDAGKRVMTGAVGHKRVPREFLEALPTPLPPLEEQRRIVAVLDEAFEGLDRARAHAEANLNDANELFEEELGRVFSMNGKGWKVEKIGDICTLKSGKTVSKDRELPAGGIPYVKVGDMNLEANSNGITTSTRFLDREAISNNQIFPKGTTIFPKRGGAIMTNKKRIVLKEICADLNVMGVMPGKEIKADFLHYYFLSLDMRQIGSGAAVPQINNYDIAPLELQYPADLNEQSRIAEMITMLRHRTSEAVQAYTCQLEDLDSLRQSLLQRAFAGELT